MLTGRPLHATVGFDLGNDSLMWDPMGQPMPTTERRRSTNPFLTLGDTQLLLGVSGESSGDGYVPQGFTQMGINTNVQQSQQQGEGVTGNVQPVGEQQSVSGDMWVVIQDLRGQVESLLQEMRQSCKTLSGAEARSIAAMRGVWPGCNGRVGDMAAGHRQGSFADGVPWDQWPPGVSLVQPQPGLWHGDEQPTSFQNVAGVGVPDDRSGDSGYVRPVVWDMGVEWTQRRQLPTVLPRQQQGPTVVHQQRQLPQSLRSSDSCRWCQHSSDSLHQCCHDSDKYLWCRPTSHCYGVHSHNDMGLLVWCNISCR